MVGLGIRPLVGFAFVEPDQAMESRVGLIYIPERSQTVKGYSGTCRAANPTHEQSHELVGKKVVYVTWTGQQFDWGGKTYVKVRIENIIAVTEGADSVKVTDVAYGVQRCRFCKSKGEGNVILAGDGSCPVCGRTSDGRKLITPEVKVSEEERELLSSPLSVRWAATGKVSVGFGRAKAS